jgi:hypothetical protein
VSHGSEGIQVVDADFLQIVEIAPETSRWNRQTSGALFKTHHWFGGFPGAERGVR